MKPGKRAKLQFDSKAVYYPHETSSNSINAPLYLSSSFQYDADIYQRVVDGERKAVNIYGRCGNPTEYQFEEQMAIVESADACLATASGMAAISVALFGLLKSGDHIVCDWTTYSSTHEMLDHRLTDYGITTTFVDTADLDAVRAAIRPNTRVLYFETIANPTMKVANVAGPRRAGARTRRRCCLRQHFCQSLRHATTGTWRGSGCGKCQQVHRGTQRCHRRRNLHEVKTAA